MGYPNLIDLDIKTPKPIPIDDFLGSAYLNRSIQVGNLNQKRRASGLSTILSIIVIALGLILGVILLSGGINSTAAAPTLSAEQSVRVYYSLIEQEQYEIAYEMLSAQFRINASVPTLSAYRNGWSESGPAIISGTIIATDENGDKATLSFTVFYSRKQVYHRLQYDLVRSTRCTTNRFGCWQIVSARLLN
jgi:hypothetical protein